MNKPTDKTYETWIYYTKSSPRKDIFDIFTCRYQAIRAIKKHHPKAEADILINHRLALYDNGRIVGEIYERSNDRFSKYIEEESFAYDDSDFPL